MDLTTPVLHAKTGTWSDGLVISLLLIGALAVRSIPLGFGIESTDILLYGLGQLVRLHYLLVFVWEIVFVLGLT